MSKLLQTTIIRPAQALSPKEIDSIAHTTHPEGIQSKTYKSWCKIGLKRDKKLLESSMQSFIKESYISISDFSSGFKEILQFAEYNAYDFSLDELKKYATQSHLEKMFGQEFRKGVVSTKSDYYKNRTILEDTIIGQIILPIRIPHTYDISKALHTLELCKRLYLFKDSKRINCISPQHLALLMIFY